MTVTDLLDEIALAAPLASLRDFMRKHSIRDDRVRFVLGKHELSDFEDADMIVRNPDVPMKSVYIAHAKKNHISVENDITLFLKNTPSKNIVAVTGTRGKTTTTTLIHKIIASQYPDAILGGNVTVSPLAHFDEVSPHTPVVLELSSFMLENFDASTPAPHIAVLTNLMPDHLEKHGSFQAYKDAKRNIMLYQGRNDFLVTTLDNEEALAMSKDAPAQVYYCTHKGSLGSKKMGCYEMNGHIHFSDGQNDESLIDISKIRLLGKHNVGNVMLAVCAAKLADISDAKIRNAVYGFTGVPHRLELIADQNGVRYYNDTTSTTPYATVAALDTFPDNPIILIAGGNNAKGLDLSEMNGKIADRVKKLILLPGKASESFPAFGQKVSDMKEAVALAHQGATSGDIVLLSPGVSWLPFYDEFTRGMQFIEEVKKITGSDEK